MNEISLVFLLDDIQYREVSRLCWFNGFGRMPQILSPFSPLGKREADRCGEHLPHKLFSAQAGFQIWDFLAGRCALRLRSRPSLVGIARSGGLLSSSRQTSGPHLEGR